MKLLPLDAYWFWGLILLSLLAADPSCEAAERITPRAADFSQAVHEEAMALGRARSIVQSCQLSADLLASKRRLIRRLEALLSEKDIYASEDVSAWILEGERSVSRPVKDCAARESYLRGEQARDETLLRELSTPST